MKTAFVIIFLMVISLLSCDLEEELDKAIIDVSGKVSNDGAAVPGVIVLLVEDTGSLEGLALANGSITDNSGNYTILAVDPGDYYVLAVDDANGNLQFDEATDQLGFYGVNPDAMDVVPDQITVDDKDLEDIDIISLYSL